MPICEQCHTEFESKNPTSRFCGAACSITATNKARRSLPLEKLCECCQTPFKPAKARSRFCSLSCAARANNPKRTRAPLRSGAVCLACGLNFKPRGREARKYCSNKCQSNHKWTSIVRPAVLRGNGAKDSCRRYLIEELGEVCAICGQLPVWQGKPLTLQLDHKDGNSDNWVVDNIQLLCPNCHTQTETYGAKGTGNRVKKQTKRNQYLRKLKGYAS